MIKLGIYVAFFFMLLRFYGLPIHIMRDLFMTTRDFLKRLNALLRYRRAIQEMNKYPDATAEELAQESTCIICREDMQPWDPIERPTAIDRIRPKKLPCGHVLHLGCLKSWLERQQVCPTCRSPVTMDRPQAGANRAAAGMRIQIGGADQAPVVPDQQQQEQQPPNLQAARPQNGAVEQAGQNPPAAPQGRAGGGPRVFNFGPIRFGFGAGGQQARELAQQFGLPGHAATPVNAGVPAPNAPGHILHGDSIQNVGTLLQDTERIVQQEIQSLQATQQELQVANLLMSELHRLRQRRQMPSAQSTPGPLSGATNPQQSTFAHGQGVFPQYPQVPGFAGIPARIGTPSLVRHGTSANSPAIPAGSPELPDGVTLPPGWSLIPLQRLDGSQTASSTTTQNAPASGAGEGSSGGRAAPGAIAQQPVDNSSGVPITSNATHAGFPASTTLADQQAPSGGNPTVVAPNPVAPQWGGPAQLFGSRPASTASQPTHQAAVPGSAIAADGEAQRGGTQTEGKQPAASHVNGQSAGDSSQHGSGSEKGKAKAVTVEEVNEAGQD